MCLRSQRWGGVVALLAFQLVSLAAEQPETGGLPERGICAHRGASVTHPENTLAAFREAIRLGAHMIEFDVGITVDGKLVIVHDSTVDRTTNGSGKVSELTFAAIRALDAGSWKGAQFKGEKVPTLDEALAVMPENIWLNVHLKGGAEIAEESTRRIVAHGRLHQAFLACRADAARAAKTVDPRIQICNMQNQANNLQYVDATIAAKSEFIQLYRGKVSPVHTKKLREHGVRINFCCSNDPVEGHALFEAGVEFPLVDDLEPMMKVADAAGIARLVPEYRSSTQFGSGDAIRFTEHLIGRDYAYPYGLSAADLDGDGDLDITSADYQPHNRLYLYENDGSGQFRRHFIQKNAGRRIERHRIGDVDGDGLLDIGIVKNLYGHLLWFRNTGNPLSAELWPRHIVTTCLPGAYNVDLADFDGDGDLDVVGSSWVLGNQFAWFENDGSPADGEWAKHFIEKSINETRGVRVADFDGDGDLDVYGAATTTGQINWYENSGRPATDGWTKHVIDNVGRPAHGSPVDMDGDGDIDLVHALGMNLVPGPSHHVVWYENDGSPRSPETWTQHIITDDFSDGFEALAEDMDGDGDVDVVATSWRSPGRLAWFENTGDPKSGWRTHVLKNNWRSANNVIIADLNGDGRPDIAAIAEHTSSELRWWRNEGRDRAPPVDFAAAARRVEQTVGHQGAKGERPANTVVSVRHGIASGASCVEVDLQMTADGEIVVHHNSTLDETTDGEGRVSATTFAEIRKLDAGSWFDPKYHGERIPTLRETLALCRDQIDLLLDLKVQGSEFNQKVAREIRAYGSMKRTIIGVRSAEQAREFRRLVGTCRQLGLTRGPEQIADFVAAGVQMIRLRKRSLPDPANLQRLRKHGVGLLLNGGDGRVETVRSLLRYEPQSLSSDFPARLVASLAQLGGAPRPGISVAIARPSDETLRVRRKKAANRHRRIIMNNDGNDCRAREPGTPETAESMLALRTAPLVGTQVDAIFYCTGIFNLYRHESRLTETKKDGERGETDWGWKLGEHEPDILATIVSFAHRHSKELFWSMRMNDTHDSKYELAMSEWKKQHPEYMVGKEGQTFEYGRCRWKGRWSSLNYELPEVRERAFRILEDVAKRYDVDGLELDFFRHPIYFKPQMFGEPVTQEQCDIMTNFLRRVRAMTEEQSVWRGRPLLIAVRLPDSVGYARAIGLDVERWLQDDLVDIVTGGGYFQLEPWEKLGELGRRFDVPVYACLSASRLGFPTGQGDRFSKRRVVGIEEWRGQALTAWEAGVSGIYVFNVFNPHEQIYREIGDPELLKKLDWTYRPVPGRIDHWVKGGEQFVELRRFGSD